MVVLVPIVPRIPARRQQCEREELPCPRSLDDLDTSCYHVGLDCWVVMILGPYQNSVGCIGDYRQAPNA